MLRHERPTTLLTLIHRYAIDYLQKSGNNGAHKLFKKNATKVVAHTNAEPVEVFHELRQKRRESPTRLSLTLPLGRLSGAL